MALFSKKKKEDPVQKSVGDEIEKLQEKKEDVEKVKPSVQVPKGGDDSAYHAVSSPHLTEKASNMGALNKYIFKVGKASNKIEIKKAIEKMYKVKVRKVAILLMPSKARRVGKYEGEKAGFKKAIVTLIEGDKIEITG